MNTLITSVVTAGLMMVGAQAFAGDTTSPQMDNLTGPQQATVKACVDRMTTKNDGTSADKITIACRQELKDGTVPTAKDEPKKY